MQHNSALQQIRGLTNYNFEKLKYSQKAVVYYKRRESEANIEQTKILNNLNCVKKYVLLIMYGII